MNRLLKEILSSPSAISLILSNFLVLCFALFSNLSTIHLLLIYLIEVFIIIFISITGLIVAKYFFNNKHIPLKKSLFLYIFGTFWFLFYIPFIFVIAQLSNVTNLFPSVEIFNGFIAAIIVLFLSHLFSILIHFKDNVNYSEEGFIVSRMFLFHFAIIFGFMLGIFLGNTSFGVILIFTLVKLAFDLPSHLELHKNKKIIFKLKN
ncbi:MAG: DUF6498-containing protein [archaeon]|jgi:hypothetical protein